MAKKKTAKKEKKEIKKKEVKKEIGAIKPVVAAHIINERVITEPTDAARELYNSSIYGDMLKDRVQLSFIEAFYLMDKQRLSVVDGRGKEIPLELFLKKARRNEKNFWTRYCIFRDFRDRGYVIKTALKFGADFRVYDRGKRPGEAHAKWIVYAVDESGGLTWYEFAAKNRVAHSTKKRLLIGIVDAENDVSYWEVKWIRP